MKNYLHVESATGQKCHDCGEKANIVFIAEKADRETGYIDELALCNDCADKRSLKNESLFDNGMV